MSGGDLHAKYTEWAATLLQRREALRRARVKLAWLLAMGFVSAPLGLHWSKLTALFIFGGWAGAWVSALYISFARDGDYTRQLEATRLGLQERERVVPKVTAPDGPKVDPWSSRRQTRRATW